MKLKIQAPIIAAFLLFTPLLFAANLAKLQTQIASGTDVKIAKEIRKTISDTIQAHSRWTYKKTVKLGSAKNCFTESCLKKAGVTTKATAGIRIRFSGEAQIYDWSVEIYNLTTGALLSSKKGACELCGKSEVLRTFKDSLTHVLNAAEVKKGKVKTVPTKVTKLKKKIDKKVKTKKEKKENSLPNPDSFPTTSAPSQKTTTSSLDDMNSKLTKIVIEVVPNDALILLNDKEIAKGTTDMELARGSYVFQFKREGYSGLKETINVGEASGKSFQLKIHLSKTDPEALYLSANEGVVDSLNQRALWGWVAVGSGVGFLATGVVLSRMDGSATCNSGKFQQCPEVYDTGTSALVTTAVGAVLLTSGVGLILWETLAGAPATPEETTILPTWNNGGGISVQTRF